MCVNDRPDLGTSVIDLAMEAPFARRLERSTIPAIGEYFGNIVELDSLIGDPARCYEHRFAVARADVAGGTVFDSEVV